MCFACHSYILAYSMHKWRHSISVLFPEFIPFVCTGLLYHVLYVPLYLKKPMTSRLKAVFWRDATFNRLALVVLVLRGFNSFLLPIQFALITYFSVKVDMVPAVVQSFTTFSTFLTAIFFYVKYGERLTVQHVLGMVLIIGGVMVVAIEKSLTHLNPLERNENDDFFLTAVEEYDEIVSVLRPASHHSFLQLATPYFVAFIACFFLASNSYLARLSMAANYPSVQFCFDFSMAAGLAYFFSFLVSNHFDPYPWECIVAMAIAGAFCLTGFIFLNLAVITGKGALAIAVSQMQSFFWLLLDIMLDFRIPHFYEIVSMALEVAGAAAITFAKK